MDKLTLTSQCEINSEFFLRGIGKELNAIISIYIDTYIEKKKGSLLIQMWVRVKFFDPLL